MNNSNKLLQSGYSAKPAHLRRWDELLHIDLRRFRKQIDERMTQITHINDMDGDMRAVHKMVSDQVVNSVMREASSGTSDCAYVVVLLQMFAGACIQKGYLELGERRVMCNALEQLELKNVEKGYLYAFHAPEPDIDGADSILEQYYMEAFQVACMDVVREWIRSYLESRNSVHDKKYCSPSFGPGYYGMGLDVVPELLGIMNAAEVGVTWTGERMAPKMSLVGAYLIAGDDVFAELADCENCIGHGGGCEFCVNRVRG